MELETGPPGAADRTAPMAGLSAGAAEAALAGADGKSAATAASPACRTPS